MNGHGRGAGSGLGSLQSGSFLDVTTLTAEAPSYCRWGEMTLMIAAIVPHI